MFALALFDFVGWCLPIGVVEDADPYNTAPFAHNKKDRRKTVFFLFFGFVVGVFFFVCLVLFVFLSFRVRRAEAEEGRADAHP